MVVNAEMETMNFYVAECCNRKRYFTGIEDDEIAEVKSGRRSGECRARSAEHVVD